MTVWNRAAEELYGYPVTEMIGRPADHLYPLERMSLTAVIGFTAALLMRLPGPLNGLQEHQSSGPGHDLTLETRIYGRSIRCLHIR